MPKTPYSFYARWWRCDNQERQELIEELLDQFCTKDREILKILFSLKEYDYIKKPTLRKASSIMGLPVTTIHYHLKQIRRKLPKNFF